MAAGAKVIQLYKGSTNRKRIDLLCDNYSRINKIITADVNVLIYLVLEDKASLKREENGDLGVRVKGSSISSSPVENHVISKSMVEEAIKKCDFSNGIIKGIDHEMFVMERADAHRLIRRDLGKFNEQLDCLDDDEREFFLPYIMKNKCIDDMADELGISYKATQQKITRIKRKINEGMHPFDCKQ